MTVAGNDTSVAVIGARARRTFIQASRRVGKSHHSDLSAEIRPGLNVISTCAPLENSASARPLRLTGCRALQLHREQIRFPYRSPSLSRNTCGQISRDWNNEPPFRIQD